MKNLKYIIVIVLSFVFIWYFFIKQYDYLISFKIKTSPGNLYTNLLDFNLVKSQIDSFAYVLNEKIPFSRINEDITVHDITINYDWKFNSINDSIVMVKVGLIEDENSFYNRLTAPFATTPFKKTALNIIKDFKNGIDYQLKNKIKVKISGIDTIPTITYAYLNFENIKMEEKAIEMMKNNSMLLMFIKEHNLKKGDFPFVIINNWNREDGTINFRYCFPIVTRDSMPNDNVIKFDTIQSMAAIRAIYNGNYKTSDRGWFALYEYSKRHNMSVDLKPIEFFKNNPQNGGNELEWVADIYMPLK
jgi:effector-binding domain-containing protein